MSAAQNQGPEFFRHAVLLFRIVLDQILFQPPEKFLLPLLLPFHLTSHMGSKTHRISGFGRVLGSGTRLGFNARGSIRFCRASVRHTTSACLILNGRAIDFNTKLTAL